VDAKVIKEIKTASLYLKKYLNFIKNQNAFYEVWNEYKAILLKMNKLLLGHKFSA